MKKIFSCVVIACMFLLGACGGGGHKDPGAKHDKVEGHEHHHHHHPAEIQKIVITAYIEIKADMVDKFRSEIEEVITKSREEEGNASYNLFADLKENNKFVFVEEWKSQAAVESHFNTEHFKKFNTLMDEVAAAPAKIKQFEVAREK